MRRPVLVDGAEILRETVASGDEHVVVKHPHDVSYTVLTGEEADLLPLLDGRTPLAELPLEAVRLVGLLDAHGLLAGRSSVDAYASVTRAIERPDRLSARVGRVMRDLEAEWKGAEKLVVALYRFVLRPFFTVPGAVLGVVLTIAGGVVFGFLVTGRPFPATQSAGWGLALLIAMELIVVAIHELGHALVLVHHGRRVHGAGFRIYFGAPAFYIESSDALMLPRHVRILQSAAGPWFEAMTVGTLAIALLLFPSMPANDVVWRFLALNYFGLFLNLVPLLELDGYWILSDWLRIPDLRPRSLAFVRDEMWKKLGRRARWTRGEVGLALYGTVGVAFTALCLVTSVFFWERTFGGLVRSLWDGGWAGRIGLFVLAFIVGGPVIRAGARFVGSLAVWLRATWRRLRFRAQRTWRVEGAHLVDASPLFGDLPVEVLNDVAGRLGLRHHSRGAIVVRQGDRADAYHLIRDGTAEVIEHEGGTERVIRTLGPGDGFGEVGLLDGAPRTASVRTLSPLETIVIDRATFERLLATAIASRPSYAPSLGDADRLRRLRALSHLSTEDLLALAGSGRWLDVEAGVAIVTLGEAAQAFYVIESGRLEVSEDGEVRRELRAGEHFGEVGLLRDGVRTATVRALTPARLFEIGPETFRAFIVAGFRAGKLRPHAEARPRTG